MSQTKFEGNGIGEQGQKWIGIWICWRKYNFKKIRYSTRNRDILCCVSFRSSIFVRWSAANGSEQRPVLPRARALYCRQEGDGEDCGPGDESAAAAEERWRDNRRRCWKLAAVGEPGVPRLPAPASPTCRGGVGISWSHWATRPPPLALFTTAAAAAEWRGGRPPPL